MDPTNHRNATPHEAMPAPRDPLAAAYHAAAQAHVEAIKSGSPLEILLAYRGVLAAERALLRDCDGALDQAGADALTYELEAVDRELGTLASLKEASPPSPGDRA